jgi:hypothetical protein
VAAQKLRDEEWWQQTLAPLARLERAASMAAVAAPAGGAASDDGPRAAAAAKRRQQAAEAAEQSAARLAAAREDAELRERAQRVGAGWWLAPGRTPCWLSGECVCGEGRGVGVLWACSHHPL